MKYDVFISYSRKDSAIVKKFADELSNAGYSVWMDVDGIETGDEFKRKIVSAIENSEIFLFFSSSSSNISQWTVKEVNVAVELKKNIIPIKLDGSAYNKSVLFDLAGLDFLLCESRSSVSDASAKLLRSLEKKIGRGGSGNTVHNGRMDMDGFPRSVNASTFRRRIAYFSFLILFVLLVGIIAWNVGSGSVTSETVSQDNELSKPIGNKPNENLPNEHLEHQARYAQPEKTQIVSKEGNISNRSETVAQNGQNDETVSLQEKGVEKETAPDVVRPKAISVASKPSMENQVYSINGHEYVDLGLPSGLKWATCNIGASLPMESGGYFAWGEVAEKDNYIPQNSETYGEALGDIAGDSSYDVARVLWGGSWRLPTKAEFDELLDHNNCDWLWTKRKGVYGYRITGKRNGKSIFLPAAGHFAGTSIYNEGTSGYYWSSTPQSNNDTGNSYLLYFYGGDRRSDSNFRTTGYCVRPVSE